MAFRSPKNVQDSQKFGRYYYLLVEALGGQEIDVNGELRTLKGQVLTIKYPLTCEFSITRSNQADVNEAKFTVYNLNEKTRMSLFKDPYDINTSRSIEAYIGYKNDDTNITPLVFRGTLKQCYSERVGSDFKTIIECFDGQIAMTSGFISSTTSKGSTSADVYEELAKTMPGVISAKITTGEDGQSKRGVVTFGNPAQILKELTNAEFYIDKQKLYVIDQSDVFEGDVKVIDDDSGILDIPRKTQTSVTVSILFEPRILISQLIKLNSSVGKIYNGEYKVTGITHQGVVSGAVGGDYRTILSLISLGGAVPVYRVIQDNNTFKGSQVILGEGNG